QQNRVEMEVGVDVARWRKQAREKIVARSVGLRHRRFAPDIALRSHCVFKGRKRICPNCLVLAPRTGGCSRFVSGEARTSSPANQRENKEPTPTAKHKHCLRAMAAGYNFKSTLVACSTRCGTLGR